ncbi:RICIN domain-containing protein [Serratia marcescens]|uniref:RICIN domain-containing protein n=1 Tax=Serratia marcescens TaxID=615 RepID=UPI001461703D|nr:RICIN domain-containing protein [Serratia marcescens]MBH2705895.1 ricin-type beta-trefoil lectin domain protein [Serratia marcescens]MBH2705907.1 ricin-type beta-trefoil lectin domain protein [Serratia marcescens]MBH3187425.1 ricin-type beta-trefoil lectin domain protein [Serratia marcescens]NMQ35725.1 ricin-type beta-trefoil lectin domain protein [Serratia marcescens]
MKKRLSLLLIIMASSFSVAAVSKDELQESKVITVTSKTTSGSLSIANGRNCLAENAQGHPALLPCDTKARAKAVETTVHYITLQSGQCLTDNGNDNPGVTTCDYQNKNQQWLALEGVKTTEVRNVASRKCLTAAGLNNRVTMATCNGIPAQSWEIPL